MASPLEFSNHNLSTYYHSIWISFGSSASYVNQLWGTQYTDAEQIKFSPAIHLPLDQF